eukprot:TRINITY_DN545_c0_g1_i1.p1 TRINITY_DN545_c0_g1~~TRINITY_DN545_c0_g1_i1.p1  ORF type:complete len:717 (+),score=139.58 TRINITY_DN545_c0_g1_i1:313-2463(+)
MSSDDGSDRISRKRSLSTPDNINIADGRLRRRKKEGDKSKKKEGKDKASHGKRRRKKNTGRELREEAEEEETFEEVNVNNLDEIFGKISDSSSGILCSNSEQSSSSSTGTIRRESAESGVEEVLRSFSARITGIRKNPFLEFAQEEKEEEERKAKEEEREGRSVQRPNRIFGVSESRPKMIINPKFRNSHHPVEGSGSAPRDIKLLSSRSNSRSRSRSGSPNSKVPVSYSGSPPSSSGMAGSSENLPTPAECNSEILPSPKSTPAPVEYKLSKTLIIQTSNRDEASGEQSPRGSSLSPSSQKSIRSSSTKSPTRTRSTSGSTISGNSGHSGHSGHSGRSSMQTLYLSPSQSHTVAFSEGEDTCTAGVEHETSLNKTVSEPPGSHPNKTLERSGSDRISPRTVPRKISPRISPRLSPRKTSSPRSPDRTLSRTPSLKKYFPGREGEGVEDEEVRVARTLIDSDNSAKRESSGSVPLPPKILCQPVVRASSDTTVGQKKKPVVVESPVKRTQSNRYSHPKIRTPVPERSEFSILQLSRDQLAKLQANKDVQILDISPFPETKKPEDAETSPSAPNSEVASGVSEQTEEVASCPSRENIPEITEEKVTVLVSARNTAQVSPRKNLQLFKSFEKPINRTQPKLTRSTSVGQIMAPIFALLDEEQHKSHSAPALQVDSVLVECVPRLGVEDTWKLTPVTVTKEKNEERILLRRLGKSLPDV